MYLYKNDKTLRIFFITYWGVKDGLSVSTVYPNLEILSKMDTVKEIIYFTIERQDNQQFKDALPPIKKVQHIPIQIKNIRFPVLSKILEWRKIEKSIMAIAKKMPPNLCIGRGAMAGPFGAMIYKKMGIPYVVESFEPHADYMIESGVWKEGGLKHKFQAKKEQEIKSTADILVTVSNNYAQHLVTKENFSKDKIYTVPCVVNAAKFGFNQEKGLEVRKNIGINNEPTVGVYLGKFGGIYYDQKAFSLFKKTYDYFDGNFFLILLTPAPISEVKEKLKAVNYPLKNVWIGIVPHAEVPNYLSAADFAFSTIKPADCRRFCSPIKNGEYWANGLPILLPEGVGDDSDIIHKEGGGAILDVDDNDSVRKALDHIKTQINTPNYRSQIKQLALKHRHPSIGEVVYEQIIDKYIKD